MVDSTNRNVRHKEWWTMNFRVEGLDAQLTELVNALSVVNPSVEERIEWLDKSQAALRSLHQLEDCMDRVERRHDSEL